MPAGFLTFLHARAPFFGNRSQSGSLGAQFFGINFGVISGAISKYFVVKSESVDPFLNVLLEALGGCLGRFPGALGALFGGPVFQIHVNKQYRTHVF